MFNKFIFSMLWRTPQFERIQNPPSPKFYGVLIMFSSGFRVDNYTLVAQLGSNAFGPVWSARESILNRVVTINFLDKNDDVEIYRFTRATSILSRLNHSAIVKLTGSGFINHLPFLATEYVLGPTLASLISNGGRMDELRVLQIASQVADALNHGWLTAEVIHRNLSPENILVELASLTEEDFAVRVKVTDFGHALGQRLVDQNDVEFVAAEAEFQRLTKSESVGSLLTMAPEQIRGSKLSPAADMYALGVIMYLLLTGKAPFSGTDEQIRNAHLRNTPFDLGSLVPGLQSGTAALVRRLLGKSPEARFQDWTSCLERLTTLRQRLEAGRKTPVPHERGSPVGNHRSSQDYEAVPSEVHERRKGDQGSHALRRKTETFLRTPQGHGVSGGVQGGGAQPSQGLNRHSRIEPVPDSIPVGWVPQTGAPEHHLIFALLAERIHQNAKLQPSPTPARTLAPTLDDGLTSEQRAAVWSYLFRASTIPGASLSGVPMVPGSPEIQSPLPEIPDDGHHLRSQDLSPSSFQGQQSAPVIEEEPIAPELVHDDHRLYSSLFVAVDPEHASNNTTTAPDEVATLLPDDVGRKPAALSMWWKPVTEILRVAVIGRVRYQDRAPSTLTQRFTSRLRRLVANREACLVEVIKLTESGNFDEAEKLLDRVAVSKGAAGNDDQMCLLRSRISALRGDATNAMFWAQVAVGQNSGNPLALAIVGYHHLLDRHVAAAKAIYEELTSCHPQSALGPLGQACLLFLSGFDKRAEEALRIGSSREKLPAMVQLSAIFCRANGDVDGEMALLRQLLTGTAADWEINERLQEAAQRRDLKTGSSRITVGIIK